MCIAFGYDLCECGQLNFCKCIQVLVHANKHRFSVSCIDTCISFFCFGLEREAHGLNLPFIKVTIHHRE